MPSADVSWEKGRCRSPPPLLLALCCVFDGSVGQVVVWVVATRNGVCMCVRL